MAFDLSSLFNTFGASPSAAGAPAPTSTAAPTTPAPTSATYDAKNPPPGFTAQQWRRLLRMSKTNPTVADLIKKYTDGLGSGGGSADDAWRRTMPTDTSQLLKQLSYNTGEMGMPGGYVGAIQLPAYGSTQPPVNNPDMSKYGQAPAIGEATFYRQSIKGGMAPIAAMSPLGVPEGWNPGGASAEEQLKDYLDKLGKGGGGGGGGGSMSTADALQKSFADWRKKNPNGGSSVWAPWGILDARGGLGKKKAADTSNKPTTNGNNTGTKPGVGIPIELPFGF